MSGLSITTKISFDKAKILAAVAKGEKTALMRGAGLVRIIAKRLIRKRKKVSLPGQPPSSHKGQLRNLMRFDFDTQSGSVVVGPEYWSQAAQRHVPQTLEFGGPATGKDRRRVRKIGDGGEMRVSSGRFAGPGRGKGGRFTGRGKTTKAVNTTGGKVVQVTYMKIKTAAQAARATAINADLFRPGKKTVAPRPFMGPALKFATPALPDYWRNSVVA
ncbi:MAG: hypothetical protein K8R92_00780 [Planctomycetes bacterium]|nr:hypothetical protein [Planctomycetota bacterium]